MAGEGRLYLPGELRKSWSSNRPRCSRRKRVTYSRSGAAEESTRASKHFSKTRSRQGKLNRPRKKERRQSGWHCKRHPKIPSFYGMKNPYKTPRADHPATANLYKFTLIGRSKPVASHLLVRPFGNWTRFSQRTMRFSPLNRGFAHESWRVK